ncbi:M20 family metallo-hydrolase [bacterium]|nr:M20 family metallo-hydrolase [bacterium]
MKVNADRLWDMHLQVAALTDPASPFTRRSFTPQYREMRTWLRETLIGLGLPVTVDAAGNLLGTYPGTGDRYIAVGSHTDTVPCGGRFDGVSGVLAFVEAFRCMQEAGFSPVKSIVGIDFLAEEPSEFRLSCIGSRLATGNFTDEMMNLEHRQTKKSLRDALAEWGGDPTKLFPGRSLFADGKFDGFLELHIEQGPILESRNLDVGLVEGICSVTRYDFTVLGRADHAGNTPMNMRSDAVVASARVIDAISRIAGDNLSKGPYFTATVGKVDVSPNGTNIIAEKVDFSLDIRSQDNALVDASLEAIFRVAEETAEQTGTQINTTRISRSQPAMSDPALLAVLEKVAGELDLSHTRMLSGAGHDAAYVSKIMPMAMIFIPCRDGRSHTASEFSSREQLEKGANLLLHSLAALSA